MTDYDDDSCTFEEYASGLVEMARLEKLCLREQISESSLNMTASEITWDEQSTLNF
jgi:hypothetical protein